jgi:hypothetical protein
MSGAKTDQRGLEVKPIAYNTFGSGGREGLGATVKVEGWDRPDGEDRRDGGEGIDGEMHCFLVVCVVVRSKACFLLGCERGCVGFAEREKRREAEVSGRREWAWACWA